MSNNAFESREKTKLPKQSCSKFSFIQDVPNWRKPWFKCELSNKCLLSDVEVDLYLKTCPSMKT